MNRFPIFSPVRSGGLSASATPSAPSVWRLAASNHPFYQAIRRLSEIRASQPALRYGRLYFRPISGDSLHFGASPFAPEVLAFSRILNDREVLVVANADTQRNFQGHVLVDLFLNQGGDQVRVLNDASAAAPGPVETRAGLAVSLRPMEVHLLAKSV